MYCSELVIYTYKRVGKYHFGQKNKHGSIQIRGCAFIGENTV